MTDAREYSQVIKDVRHGDVAQLYIKDKRDGSLWIEEHSGIEIGCSAKSLLHPDGKAPDMRMPITQEDVDRVVGS